MVGICLRPTMFCKFGSLVVWKPLRHLSRHPCLSKNVSGLSGSHFQKMSHCWKPLCTPALQCESSRTLLAPFLHSPVLLMRESSSQSDVKHEAGTTENYSELYLINNIRFYRLLCRFSRYSFITFLLGSPLCVASSYLNIFPTESLRIVFTCLAFYMAIFIGQSFLFSSRIVAKIMTSPDMETVKISHLTMFGNRADIYLKPSDIAKFDSFGGELMSKNFVVLRTKRPAKRLIFLPGHGGIDTNYQALEHLLCSGPEEGE